MRFLLIVLSCILGGCVVGTSAPADPTPESDGVSIPADAPEACEAGHYLTPADECKACEAWTPSVGAQWGKEAGPGCFACPDYGDVQGGDACHEAGKVVTIGLRVVCCE